MPAGISRDGRFVLVVEGGLPEAGAREALVIAPYAGGPTKLIDAGRRRELEPLRLRK